MDVDEQVAKTGLKAGDLVLPTEAEEFLFVDPCRMDAEIDPIEIVWESVPGIITRIVSFVPPRNYMRVEVMVSGITGWTYSDYVRAVQ